jgi:peroxiredoxin
MLGAGAKVPEATVFTTPFEHATLAELAAEGPVLLLFYLFDWSATCTDEVGVLDERREELAGLGVRAFGVSRDSPWTHIAWSQALDLQVPLLSDWNGEATHGLDIAHDHRGFRDVSQRAAFLVDRDGTIRYARQYDVNEVPDLDEAVAAAREL